MRLTRSLLAAALIYSLAFLSIVTIIVEPVNAQDTRVSLQRGYRTGYSDGYMSGYRDSIDDLAKSPVRHKEYIDANRAFNKDYGMIDDYRDGYRQGFETGYETGFNKSAFESTVPSDLARRGVAEISQMDVVPDAVPAIAEPAVTQRAIETPAAVANVQEIPPTATEPTAPSEPVQAKATIQQASYITDDEAMIIIPRDTELIIELQEQLGTEANSVGDTFTATVVSPVEIAGAKIEGRIDRIQKPGRIKRRSQLELSFDRIVLNERRWSNFDAILTEVMPVKGDNIRRVDNEGAAIGKSTFKADGAKIGAATGAGIGIGAVTAGPVGAAVGAGVGAAFGVGAVMVERGKHIRLNRSQQIKIKVSVETKIR